MTDDTWPTEGKVTVEWTIREIEGQPRLGWRYQSEPQLDPANAITLLRDVADELEIDLPDSN